MLLFHQKHDFAYFISFHFTKSVHTETPSLSAAFGAFVTV